MAGAGALHYVQLGMRHGHPPAVVRLETRRGGPTRNITCASGRGPTASPAATCSASSWCTGCVFAFIPRLTTARPLIVSCGLACAFELLLGGFARIYVGAHWPSDIIGSVLLAMLYLGLTWRVDRHVRHIRAVMLRRRWRQRPRLHAEHLARG